MSQEKIYKKQVAPTDIGIRLISFVLDITIIMTFLAPINNRIFHFLLNYHLKDYKSTHNVEIKDKYDLYDLLLTSENFQNYYIEQNFNIKFGLVIFAFSALITFTYFATFWIKYKTTPSKYIFRNNIVDENNLGNMTLSQACLRFIGYAFSPISIVMAFFRQDRKTIHDMMSGTIVIKN